MTGWALEPLGRLRARRAVGVVLLLHLALVVALRAAFGLALRTSDDAEMMAAVSGYDGGSPRPELLFTNVLVGHVLRALYAALPEAPWYGLYLHGLQAAAVAVIVVALLVLLEGRPRIAAVATVGAIAVLVPGFVLAVQFTIVAFLVATAGLLLFLALRRRGYRATVAAGLGGALMVTGLLVRFQPFAATVAVAGLTLPLHAVAHRRCDVRGVAALAATVSLLAGIAVTAEFSHWEGRLGTDRPLDYLTSQLATSGARPSASADPAQGVGAAPSTGPSENDRALARSWLIYAEMLEPPDEGDPTAGSGPGRTPTRTGSSVIGAALGGARAVVMPLVEDPVRFMTATGRGVARVWPWIALAAAAIALGSDRRARLGGVASLAGGLVIVGGIGATRLPDRVLLPLMLLVTLTTAIVAVSPDSGGRARPPWFRAVVPAVIGLLIAGAAAQALAADEWVDEHAWREARAERFFAELEGLEIAESETVILWLIDTWWVMDPLGWDQAARYRDRTVQLAGWQYRLPYRADQRDDYDIEDWIGAVADRDDVLLVAESDRVGLLMTLLRERRGRLCTEPVLLGSVRDGKEVVVRRIEDVPCYGVPLIP